MIIDKDQSKNKNKNKKPHFQNLHIQNTLKTKAMTNIKKTQKPKSKRKDTHTYISIHTAHGYKNIEN
jgi:hypothetical protein